MSTWQEQTRGYSYTRAERVHRAVIHWLRTWIWNQEAHDFGADDPAFLERAFNWLHAALLWNAFALRLRTAYCDRFGHGSAWVDDSYGNPESGCMAGHCDRCGHSFHVQLY
jgi:uncharacterized protein (DUF2267 family)